MRHLVILLAIITTYSLPNNDYQGSLWFAAQALPSTILITFLYFWQSFKQENYIDYLIIIETLSTSITLIACIQYGLSLKTASIYSHYEHIISAMYIAELAIIIGAVIRDVGIYTNNSILHLTLRNYVAAFRSAIFIGKTPLCKNP